MKYFLPVILSLMPLLGFATPLESARRHKAAEPLDSLVRENNIKKVTEDAIERLMHSAGKTATGASASSTSKVEEDGISLEGEWKFKTYSFYYDKEVDHELYGMLAGTTFLMVNYNKDFYPIIGDYDESTQTLTITKKYVGRDWRGRYHFIYPYVPLGNGGVKPGDFQVHFDKEKGELVFPPGVMLSWIDYEDPAGTIDPYDEMEWHIVRSTGRIGDLDKENPDNWISLGRATLIDGWLLPRFGYDQTKEENWMHPELLQYKNNSNIYRLKNPFDEEPLGQYNTCNKTGYIEFDVTDPDHVLFNRIDCGWTCPDIGITKLYCYNLLGYYMEEYKLMGNKYSVADFLLFYNPDIAFTTFRNNVVELGTMLYAGELLYDANFGEVNYPAGGNMWIGMNMKTKIYFPGETVREPKIDFTTDPEITINSKENTADVKIEFTYENQPDNSTIFVMVTDDATGKTVARKYVNQRYYFNDYTFTLDGIAPNGDYDYSAVVRIEGACSEVLYASKKKKLDFVSARKGVEAGINKIDMENDSPVYYNLQGARVDNPRKGEIYIMKRGNKTAKLIY